MAKGSSGLSGGGGGTVAVKSVGPIDLSNNPLVYGGEDPGVSGSARAAVVAWENKRAANKVEYNISVDQNGNPLHKEVRGGKGSVRVPIVGLSEGAIHTHIHPREDEGVLGGTFSDADLRNFANYGVATYRARAKEGAYSISKTGNFDKNGFTSYVNNLYAKENTILSNTTKGLRDKLRDKNYTYEQYSKDVNNAFNNCLVAMHNGLLAGQKQYGYSYTLERS